MATAEQLDYGRLLDRAADCRFVLVGEASHGTHEFYRERAQITKRLIAEHSPCERAVRHWSRPTNWRLE